MINHIEWLEQTRVDQVFPGMQEILDKITSLNKEEQQFNDQPLCLGFYD